METKREHFKVYVTKYALTTGIFVIDDAEWCTEISDKMIAYKQNNSNFRQTQHSPDWHRTPEAALAKAEEMRQAKIKSIKKNLTKLENMKFEIKEN